MVRHPTLLSLCVHGSTSTFQVDGWVDADLTNDLQKAQILHRVIFYLVGYTKEEVYKTKPRTLEELETRTQKVLNVIPNDILLKVVRSIRGRLLKLAEANDASAEI